MNAVLEALAAQNGVYTLETVTPQGERAYETIRSIERVVPWTESLDALIEAGADPACKIIAFTVTEGGYYLDEHDELDTANPDLAADLKGGHTTIYGALAAILDARMKRGAGPVTLQTCDNLRSNGERFHAGMSEFLERRGANELRAMVRRQHRLPEFDGRPHHAASHARRARARARPPPVSTTPRR